MRTHHNESPQPRTPTEDVGAAAAATPVGTFAEGQSARGSIPVVIGAEVGSFASGQAEDPTRAAL